MKDRKVFEWVPLNSEFLKELVQIEQTVGNYSIVQLKGGYYVILDRNKFKALVFDKRYFVPSTLNLWVERGFLVVSFNGVRLQKNCYILRIKDNSLIAGDEEVNIINDSNFLSKKSNYFKVENSQGKQAIFDKDGKQISDWFDWIKSEGLVSGQSTYYIAKKGGQEAIFHKSGKQISDWAVWIAQDGLVDGKSEYYIENKDMQKAIFNKEGKQISDWYDDINEEGLVNGKSDYYIVEKNDKYAIFHKDGNQTSQWFNWISPEGLVSGQSDFYLVKKDWKYAIFNKDGKQISDWFDSIYTKGLVEGKSEYYIAEKKGKRAIFHRSGEQVSEWFDNINLSGLINGKTDYYVGKRILFHYIGKLGSSKLLGPFMSIKDYGFIKSPTKNTIFADRILTKQEVEDFFNDKEVEDGR